MNDKKLNKEQVDKEMEKLKSSYSHSSEQVSMVPSVSNVRRNQDRRGGGKFDDEDIINEEK